MRELTVDDVFTVAQIAVKAGGGLNLSGERQPGETALTFFSGIMSQADDVKAWLADLQGITPDEFAALPPSALLDAIEELAGREDIADFFARAVRLGQKLTSGSTSFNRGTAGPTRKSKG